MTRTPIRRPQRNGPLTRGMIRDSIRQLPEDVRRNKGRLHSYSYLMIIEYFMGTEWLERYILPETAKRKSFLFPHLNVVGRQSLWLIDVLMLADMLYNLQSVPGFDDAIAPMMGGDIESTMSVLTAGKLLHRIGKNFQFLKPIGVRGLDPDIALMYSEDQIAFLEVKCKARTTTKSYETVINALNTAMGQLPPTQAGIVFMQIPEQWIDRGGGSERRITREILDAIYDFLRNSSRVAMLMFYTSIITTGETETTVDHGYIEVVNEDSRHANRDWVIFGNIADWRDAGGTWDSVDQYPPEALITDEPST
jgi:hypothetical protein